MNEQQKVARLRRGHPDQQEVLPLVLADLQERAGHGKSTYGGPLETNNGLDALQEAYEEALDLVMYLRQALAEQEQRPVPLTFVKNPRPVDIRIPPPSCGDG